MGKIILSTTHVARNVITPKPIPGRYENGLKMCARLERKKSPSLGEKKIRVAKLSRKMSRGGLNQPPPPRLFGVKCGFFFSRGNITPGFFCTEQ